MINTNSKTEKFLSLIILGLFVGLLGFGISETSSITFADEDSTASSDSGDESTPSSDEESSPSADEESIPSVDEESVDSVDEVSTPSVDEESVDSIDELSTPSTGDEISTASLESEPSTVSTASVQSVSSGNNVDSLNRQEVEVIPVGDFTAYVFEDERFLFLVPVKIQKMLELDEDGNILNVRQTFLNRLLSLFSF